MKRGLETLEKELLKLQSDQTSWKEFTLKATEAKKKIKKIRELKKKIADQENEVN